MLKFLQFIQWCGRKIYGGLVSAILSIPKGIATVFHVLKHEVRHATFLFSLLWAMFTAFLLLVSLGISASIALWFSIKHTPFVTITEVVISISIVLYATLVVGMIYDMFEEEQEQLMDILKKK